MQVLQGEHDRRAVKLGLVLCQISDFADCIEEIASAEELCKKVNIMLILKGLDELHYARMVALRIDVTLYHQTLLLVLSDNLQLVHALQGIDLTLVFLVSHKLHNAESTPANNRLQSQVCHGHVQVLQVHSVLQVSSEHADNVPEDASFQSQADARVLSLASRRALLLEQKSALPEVVPSAESPKLLAILEDAYDTTLYQEEVSGIIALLHNDVPSDILCFLQCSDGMLNLILRQILEEENV
mmetsp:Transcript_47620/g.89200  ORF Transcript_47620/g.89200 Transcript_47620/m.89200 type:complete len:242 (+) Transcript_47620:660-1385(+)